MTIYTTQASYSQPEKTGFVYIWYDRKDKRFYIGCHWGPEDDGYICSSDWMNSAYAKRPHDFKRRIIRRNIESRAETLDEELRYLHMIKSEERKSRYYNIRITNNNAWLKNPENIKTVGQKISAAKRGRKLSSEHCIKISAALTGRTPSDETRTKLSAAKIGRKRSAETRAKMSAAKIGIKLSLEHRAKLSIVKKNMSDETRAKIAVYRTGRKISSATRTKISAAKIGRKHSPETRAKISAALTGRRLSSETRAKLSAIKIAPHLPLHDG